MADTTPETLPGIGTKPVCPACGSDRVVRDAWAAWNAGTGRWELQAEFDQGFCETCDGETGDFSWVRAGIDPKPRIAALNDALRQGRSHDGTILVTQGVIARGNAVATEARHAVAAFNAFDKDNDPHSEHDFGALTVAGTRIFFKIDAYNLTMDGASPDPADPGFIPAASLADSNVSCVDRRGLNLCVKRRGIGHDGWDHADGSGRPGAFGLRRRAARTLRRRGGCWCWRVSPGQKRHARRGWTGRPFATGCIAAMRPGWRG